MRRLLCIIFVVISICFIIPIIFVSEFETKQVSTNIIENEINENINYDYKQYSTIKLLHAEVNSIEEIPIDEYLYNVVAAEMPANFSEEALKAQGIVARTYTVYKIKNNADKHEGADICDDSTCCQAWISKEDRFSKWDSEKATVYWDKIIACVEATKGKIITYDGEPINAFFHSNSGGTTEIPLDVWGGSGYPYLQAVQTSGEDAYSQYYSEIELTKQEVIQKIKEKHENVEINFEDENCIQILEYTQGGRIKTIRFGNIEMAGVEARTIFGLKSANFTVTIKDEKVKFTVIGYGHGVGMSQTGADALAKQGKNYEEIVKHYYTGVEIKNI